MFWWHLHSDQKLPIQRMSITLWQWVRSAVTFSVLSEGQNGSSPTTGGKLFCRAWTLRNSSGKSSIGSTSKVCAWFFLFPPSSLNVLICMYSQHWALGSQLSQPSRAGPLLSLWHLSWTAFHCHLKSVLTLTIPLFSSLSDAPVTPLTKYPGHTAWPSSP